MKTKILVLFWVAWCFATFQSGAQIGSTTWLGSLSTAATTDWNDPAMWSNGIPDLCTDAYIHEEINGVYPTLNGGTGQCHDLFFYSSNPSNNPIVDMAGGTLEISGQVVNHTQHQDVFFKFGLVRFVDGCPGYHTLKSIGEGGVVIGAQGNGINFYDLEIDIPNPQIINYGSNGTGDLDERVLSLVPVQVFNSLTLTHGVLDLSFDMDFVLPAGANNPYGRTSPYIMQTFGKVDVLGLYLPQSSGRGIKQQITLDKTYETWHYTTSPMMDPTIQNITSQNYGWTLNHQYFDNTTDISCIIFQQTYNYGGALPEWAVYDETLHQSGPACNGLTQQQQEYMESHIGWVSNPTLGTTWHKAGDGVAGRFDPDVDGILDFNGVPYTGDLKKKLSFSNHGQVFADGMNLIGNPYPSPLHWTLLYKLNPGKMLPFCYLWIPETTAPAPLCYPGTPSAFRGFTLSLDATDPNNLQPENLYQGNVLNVGQGFHVKLNPNNFLNLGLHQTGYTSIVYNNKMRVPANDLYTFRQAAPVSSLQLVLKNQDHIRDYCKIQIGDDFSDAFSVLEDDPKNLSQEFYIASKNQHLLTINKLHNSLDEMVVPLVIKSPGYETIEITLSNQLFSSQTHSAWLEDRLNHTLVLIDADFKWSVQVEPGENLDRFYIHFTPLNQSPKTESGLVASTADFCSVGDQEITLNSIRFRNDVVDFDLVDLTGKVVLQEKVAFQSGIGKMKVGNLKAGVYIVASSGSQSFRERIVLTK